MSRNTGIAAARFGALAILDDDMFVDKSWFGSLVGPIVHETEMVVTGQVSESREDLPGTFAPSTQAPQPPAVYEGRSPEASIYAGNMALCRAVLDDIGLFDERLGAGTSFPSSEDNDLTFRVLEAGYRLHYAPQAVVYHRAWRSADQYLRLRWDYGVGQGAFYAKYLSLRDRYMLKRMLRDVQMHFLSVPWVAITDRRCALGNAVYALGVMSGAARWLVTVRKSH